MRKFRLVRGGNIIAAVLDSSTGRPDWRCRAADCLEVLRPIRRVYTTEARSSKRELISRSDDVEPVAERGGSRRRSPCRALRGGAVMRHRQPPPITPSPSPPTADGLVYHGRKPLPIRPAREQHRSDSRLVNDRRAEHSAGACPDASTTVVPRQCTGTAGEANRQPVEASLGIEAAASRNEYCNTSRVTISHERFFEQYWQGVAKRHRPAMAQPKLREARSRAGSRHGSCGSPFWYSCGGVGGITRLTRASQHYRMESVVGRDPASECRRLGQGLRSVPGDP